VTARAFRAARIVTCDPMGPDRLGCIEDGVVAFDGATLTFVGRSADAPPGLAPVDLGARVVTPGLVDAHTHACWVGSRHAEYAARMAGADYRTIANAGGGILSTFREVAAAPVDVLASALVDRLRRMAALGVTTVEVKSGYGLEPSHELKQLAAIRAASRAARVPDVVPTLLALHALPGATVDRSEYVSRVITDVVPEVARHALARFVDAYVDAGAFTADEARAVGLAAKAAGLGVRLHVGQFADVGGAEVAADLGAASADHLEALSPEGAEALARAGTSAILLPVASFTLGQRPPPVDLLRASGIPLVVASDANPGTAPTESLPLAIGLAVRLYGLRPDEALVGATAKAAQSLGLSDRGVLRRGLRADLVAWDLPHEHAIVQPWGVAKTHMVISGGNEVA
jgi:imidazolonepropionase